MSSKGGGTTTTVQQADPWKGQQEYLSNIFWEARNLYQNGAPEYFPDSTVSPMTPYQQQGIDQLAGLGQQGAVSGAAAGELQKTLGGDYLSAGNPYFSQMADTVTASVLPSIQGQFAGGNRMGGGLAARASAEGLGSALGQLAYQNYADERTNQQRALSMAPGVQAMQQADAQALIGAGGLQQQQSQAELNDLINRWNFEQQLPANMLAQYSQLVQGNYGGTSTTTSPYYQNTGANMLGGALGGAAMGSMLGPWGTAGGAILGGLMGLF